MRKEIIVSSRWRILISLIMFFVLSCSRTIIPINRSLLRDNIEYYKDMQYYLSNDLCIMQHIRGEDDPFPTIIFKKGTPGIFEQIYDNDKMVIRFGKGKNEVLIFGDDGNDDKFYLLAKPKKMLPYGEKIYTIISPEPIILRVYTEKEYETLKEINSVINKPMIDSRKLIPYNIYLVIDKEFPKKKSMKRKTINGMKIQK